MNLIWKPTRLGMLYDGQADEKLGSAETVLPKFAFVVSCGK